MERHHHYERWLEALKARDAQESEHVQEEVNIIMHKLKYIPMDSRPEVLLISDIRLLSQDFHPLVPEAVAIAGGRFVPAETATSADKIILFQHDARLYADLPVWLEQDIPLTAAALANNQLYIVQQEAFDQPNSSSGFIRQVEILAEIIQPGYFVFGRQGTDWVQFDLSQTRIPPRPAATDV